MIFLQTLSVIADIAGILGLIVSIILIIKSEAIRKELDSQKTDYAKEQKSIKINLIGLRNNVWQDNLLTIPIKSQIRTELFKYQQKFCRLLRKKDRKTIDASIKILDGNSESINKEILCKNIDYLIARFDKKEV